MTYGDIKLAKQAVELSKSQPEAFERAMRYAEFEGYSADRARKLADETRRQAIAAGLPLSS